MNFPDMSLNGIVVKQETQIAALKLFLQNQGRQAKHLISFLEDMGVPVYNDYDNGSRLISMRIADRLLKRAKRYGVVSFSGGRWLDSHAADAFLKGTMH